MKINFYYQHFILLVGVVCVVTGWLESEVFNMMLGTLLIFGAIATIKHIRTKQHNPHSKLPKDIKL